MRSVTNKSDKEIQIDVSDVYNLGVKGINPEHLDIQENLDKIEDKYRIKEYDIDYSSEFIESAIQRVKEAREYIKSELL